MDIETGAQIIDDQTEYFREEVADMEGVFLEELIKVVKRMETAAGGKIKATDFNRSLVVEMNKAVARASEISGYNKLVKQFLTNFNELRDWQYWFHTTRNNLDIDKPLLTAAKDLMAQQTVQQLAGQGLRSSFVQPLKDELNQAILKGGNLTDLIKELELRLISTPEKQGDWRRYVTQASRDSLGQYDGYAQEIVKETYNLDTIRYVGSLVRDSRPQCRRWVRMGTIEYSDLAEEISWAKRNGKGMIRSTTTDNFLKNRGGYNCRHTAIPIRG